MYTLNPKPSTLCPPLYTLEAKARYAAGYDSIPYTPTQGMEGLAAGAMLTMIAQTMLPEVPTLNPKP